MKEKSTCKIFALVHRFKASFSKCLYVKLIRTNESLTGDYPRKLESVEKTTFELDKVSIASSNAS